MVVVVVACCTVSSLKCVGSFALQAFLAIPDLDLNADLGMVDITSVVALHAKRSTHPSNPHAQQPGAHQATAAATPDAPSTTAASSTPDDGQGQPIPSGPVWLDGASFLHVAVISNRSTLVQARRFEATRSPLPPMLCVSLVLCTDICLLLLLLAPFLCSPFLTLSLSLLPPAFFLHQC